MLTTGIINRCFEECYLSTYKYCIGAVVFKGKRIISSGHNGIRPSSISLKYKIFPNSLHAEQAALMNLDWTKLKNYSMLVLRISKTKDILGNARPCNMCLNLLLTIGINDIYYSNKNGEIVKLGNITK